MKTSLPIAVALAMLSALSLATKPSSLFAEPPAGGSVRIRSSKPRPKVNPTPALLPTSPVYPAAEASRAGDFEKTDALLSAIDPKTLSSTDYRQWRIFAAYTAPRVGDLSLLRRANKTGENLLFADARQIMNAWEVAQTGDTARAESILRKVRDPENLDERSRRRYLAMKANLARMEGDRKSERLYLTKLVDYVGEWRSDTCQSCHENPTKYGDDVTSLDVGHLWIGQRLSALLRADGDAAAFRRDAEVVLARDNGDDAARLKRAYALRAEGREAEATGELRRIDWAAFPDRPYREPDNKVTFPGEMPVPHPRPLADFVPENHLYSAYDYLHADQFARSHAELAELGPKENLTLRQRYLRDAILARLARLERDPDAEKSALRDMVEVIAARVDDAGYIDRTSPDADGFYLRDKKTFEGWNRWWVAERLGVLGDEESRRKANTLPTVSLTKLRLNDKDLTEFP